MGTAEHDAKLKVSQMTAQIDCRTREMMHSSYATTIAMENTALVWLSWTTCAQVWQNVQSQQGCPVRGIAIRNQMLSLERLGCSTDRQKTLCPIHSEPLQPVATVYRHYSRPQIT